MRFYLFISVLIVLVFFGCKTKNNNINNLSFDLQTMQATKYQIAAKEESALEDFNQLVERADKALLSGLFSVMDKKGIPDSGDKHDYLSVAPYWWPNPETSDGLPWIRKDGEVNPATRSDYSDFRRMRECFGAINVLSRAFFYSENEKYAEKAVQLIDTWFINPDTRMNPNHNHAQAVPGSSSGRPAGTVEMGGISGVITSVELLKNGNALPTDLEEGFKSWLSDYLLWYENSDIGYRSINDLHNNIGSMCDVQRIRYLVYLDRITEVKEILIDARQKRIIKQIEPDGRMPAELQRTKAWTYSAKNLRHLTSLASFGKKYGVDLWNFESQDGRSIKKAYEFLASYLVEDKTWEYQQLRGVERYKNNFANQLLNAGIEFNENSFISTATKFLESTDNSNDGS